MKTILEIAERIISCFLKMCICMGMTLIGWFFGNLITDGLSVAAMWNVFLVCVILTFAMSSLWIEVHYRRLEIMAEEMELQQNEEARELCEHLTANL